ncbi:MAG TPA: hypothetical protein VLJ83_05390 [Gemmatimonadaceae bacterium]|nr:hypothetical protein [Gemmatimonadaceae bacterium]
MANDAELRSAFDAALDQVGKCRRAGMTTVGGESAISSLDKLERDLKAERSRALTSGMVDREWFQTTVRWLVGWVPETELALIAALGRIARATPPGLP